MEEVVKEPVTRLELANCYVGSLSEADVRELLTMYIADDAIEHPTRSLEVAVLRYACTWS